jgi:hypothetical protein
MLLSDMSHLETASNLREMFTVGLPQSSLAGGTFAGRRPSFSQSQGSEISARTPASPRSQLPPSSARLQTTRSRATGQSQGGADQGEVSGSSTGQVGSQHRKKQQKGLSVSTPKTLPTNQ